MFGRKFTLFDFCIVIYVFVAISIFINLYLFYEYPATIKATECKPCITYLKKQTYNKLFIFSPAEKNVPVIDIVITWAGTGTGNGISDSSKRTRNNEELKYCLRSIFNNMAWFHKIYIVVNNFTYHNIYNHETFINSSQLDTSNISIINTYDLFCSVNQCSVSINNTNSNSIESVLHRIPNLSEYYIYFNDDWFIGRPLHWSFFYFRINNNPDNILYPRMPYLLYKLYTEIGPVWYKNVYNYLFVGSELYDSSSYMSAYKCSSNKNLLNISVPDAQMKFYRDHMPRPYVKQNWINFENQYKNWFAFVRSHKRRYFSCNNLNNIHESITLHYIKWKLFTNKININLLYYPIYDDLYFNILVKFIHSFFLKITDYHYWIFESHVTKLTFLKYHLNQIKQRKPATVCINDDGQGDENIQLITRFYADYFPMPSPIEL